MSLHQSQLQAGSLDYNGPRQIYLPKPIVLVGNVGGGETPANDIRIRLPVPSSQTRIKLSVFFAQTSGAPVDISGKGTIWIAAAEEDRSGTANGRLAVVTDVVGTEAAPLAFPVDAGMYGYSRSFVTTADWLQAVISLQPLAGARGNWVLQTSIQPEAVTFVWEAWDQIRRAFIPQVDGAGGTI